MLFEEGPGVEVALIGRIRVSPSKSRFSAAQMAQEVRSGGHLFFSHFAARFPWIRMSIQRLSSVVVKIGKSVSELLLLSFNILCGVVRILSAQVDSKPCFPSGAHGLFVTIGSESHENACVLSLSAMQFSLAINRPFLLALWMASVSSRLTCLLHARRLAHVPGIVSVEYEQPYSPVTSLARSSMRRHLWSCVSSRCGRGSDQVMTDMYIMSRSSRGRPKKLTILAPECVGLPR